MKKLSIILALTLILSLAGCGNVLPPKDANASSSEASSQSLSSDIQSDISSDEQSSSQDISSAPASSKPVSSQTQTSNKVSANKPFTKSSTPTPKSSSAAPRSYAVPKSSSQPKATGGFSESAIEQRLFVLVNEERARLGLSQLKWNNTLYKSAKIRSDEIAAANVDLEISHTRPNNTPWSTTLDEVNYSKYYTYAGENLAAVQQQAGSSYAKSNDELADIIFDGWKNSKGHYEAIIRPETKEIGIAVSRNDKDVYATQHFGQID